MMQMLCSALSIILDGVLIIFFLAITYFITADIRGKIGLWIAVKKLNMKGRVEIWTNDEIQLAKELSETFGNATLVRKEKDVYITNDRNGCTRFRHPLALPRDKARIIRSLPIGCSASLSWILDAPTPEIIKKHTTKDDYEALLEFERYFSCSTVIERDSDGRLWIKNGKNAIKFDYFHHKSILLYFGWLCEDHSVRVSDVLNICNVATAQLPLVEKENGEKK